MTSNKKRLPGLWSIPGVPHTNWNCEGSRDLEEPNHTCEMCATECIRYTSYMSHPNYPTVLIVGRICAEKMERESETALLAAAPKVREAKMKSRAGRKKRWLTRIWRPSFGGGYYTKSAGLIIAVRQQYDGWSAAWKSEYENDWTKLSQTYSSEADSKLAAFETIWPVVVVL